MPEISVIIPVYNAEKYLRTCLDSVLAQTLRDIEVVCVDDGSTDGSLAILREYERKVLVESPSPRVDGFDFKVIACEHTNAGHCRNVGLAESRGEYLMFLDADDCFAPTMCKTLRDAAVGAKADMALCGHVEFKDNDDLQSLFAPREKASVNVHQDPARNGDVFRWVPWPWDKLVARRLIGKYSLSFQEQRTTNDLLFVYSALSVAETVVECPCALVAHRRHVADSLSTTRDRSPRCFYDALVGYYGKMCELGVFPENQRLLKNFYVYSCRQSFWQFDTVAGLDAASTMFPLLKDLCIRWNWCAVMDEDSRDLLLGRRCAALMEADDILDFERRCWRFLVGCHDELDAIKRSHTYRFAQWLVNLKKQLNRIMTIALCVSCLYHSCKTSSAGSLPFLPLSVKAGAPTCTSFPCFDILSAGSLG